MHLLFVANFSSRTGYAWETIERVFRRVGESLVREGHRVSVCYARLENGPPERMRGAPFEFVAFDYGRTRTPGGLRDFMRLLRARGVDALYLTDRPTWSWRYPFFHLAGVRRLIVHDRTSGERTRRAALLRGVKRLLHHVPGLAGDCFIGVSEYVRRRMVEVNGTPPSRTWCVYNGIDLAPFAVPDRAALRQDLGLPEETRVVFCSGRAQPYKGIQLVIEAAALLKDQGVPDLAFAYAGDGGYLKELKELAARRGVENFHFLGRRDDVPRLLGGAAAAVVPSLWAEAFGLTVVEAFAAGAPLVAARTGGIPELVRDGETGVLFPPGDARALAAALRAVLADPQAAEVRAARAAREVRRRFSLEKSAVSLYALVSSQLRTSPVLAAPVVAAAEE
ncbi:MAG TPA: glycosyltransferase family 4 protein [Longimicrobium sp.]|jgi:glycosyltransferase involved in cell wall biosynthesis